MESNTFIFGDRTCTCLGVVIHTSKDILQTLTLSLKKEKNSSHFFLSSLRLLLYTEMGENANGVEEEEERDITRGYIQAKEKE